MTRRMEMRMTRSRLVQNAHAHRVAGSWRAMTFGPESMHSLLTWLMLMGITWPQAIGKSEPSILCKVNARIWLTSQSYVDDGIRCDNAFFCVQPEDPTLHATSQQVMAPGASLVASVSNTSYFSSYWLKFMCGKGQHLIIILMMLTMLFWQVGQFIDILISGLLPCLYLSLFSLE